jgi:hypothetical protein
VPNQCDFDKDKYYRDTIQEKGWMAIAARDLAEQMTLTESEFFCNLNAHTVPCCDMELSSLR